MSIFRRFEVVNNEGIVCEALINLDSIIHINYHEESDSTFIMCRDQQLFKSNIDYKHLADALDANTRTLN